MQINSNQEKLLNITKRLDKIIAIARTKSEEVSLTKEVINKLISAMAIALLATYLILFDRHLVNLPQNNTMGIAYIVGLVFLGLFLNPNRRYAAVYKLIYGILIFLGGMYYMLTIKEYWILPQNSYLSLLYIFALFLVALAHVFYLIDYVYSTPRYADNTLFRSNQELITANLAEFSDEEIDLANADAEAITNALFDRIDSNIIPNSILYVLLFWGLILINLFQIYLGLDWWSSPIVISCAIVLILLSLVSIFFVIKRIIDIRKRDRFNQYWSILTEYEIERIGIREFFSKRRPSKIIKELEEQ